MEAFYALLALCAGNLPVNGEFPSQRPVTRSFDVFMFPLICTWANTWVNNRDAGDFRRHRADYDVIVMSSPRALGTQISQSPSALFLQLYFNNGDIPCK